MAHQVLLSMGFSRLSGPSVTNILANKQVHSKLVLSAVLANQKLLSAGFPNDPRHFGQTSSTAIRRTIIHK